MPVTGTEVPILSQFLCIVSHSNKEPSQDPMSDAASTSANLQSNDASQQRNGTRLGDATPPKRLPKGVVLGKDGKPCRSCTSVSAWMQMANAQKPTGHPPAAATTLMTASTPSDCPADVEVLGRSTWTMLHTLAANYPSNPPSLLQQQTKSFLSLFSNLYPCSHCAEDFRGWMKERDNEPRVGSQDELGIWMCEAHNAVNEKLGKERFDCTKWKERWMYGPADGRCG